MRRRCTLEVHGVIFVMRGWKVHGLALGAGLRPIYSGVQQGWIADTKRLPELVAYLQHRNIPVEVVDLQPSEKFSEGAPLGAGVRFLTPADADIEIDLFGGTE